MMTNSLAINMLGELQMLAGDTEVSLPPSRKTRALLAYLASTGDVVRRERLCEMFWDIPDDPKGALRWSLSKIRGVLGQDEKARLQADRESIVLDTNGLASDVDLVRDAIAGGLGDLDAGDLRALADTFRGEFLEGLDLPKHHAFHSWCLAERETLRGLRKQILSTLIARLEEHPDQALPYARRLVDIDPLDDSLRARLIRLLTADGRNEEAKACLQAGIGLAKDFDVPVSDVLLAAGRDIGKSASKPKAEIRIATPVMPHAASTLVGRSDEWQTAFEILQHTASEGIQVLLVHGEPGIGKTRLLDEFAAAVRDQGGSAIRGCAFDGNWGRPYAPWIEALSQMSLDHAMPTGADDFASVLGRIGLPRSETEGKAGLFDDIGKALGQWAGQGQPAVLALDDVHWLDGDSVDLLRHVVQFFRTTPLLVALGGRTGEMVDNAPLQRAMRGLRHDMILHEVTLQPLSAAAVNELVDNIAEGVDPARVYAGSGGNPLFAIESARALSQGNIKESRTLADLIHDRIETIPDDVADFLRWCSVLGEQIDLNQIESLLPHTPEQAANAVETLQSHGIFRSVHSVSGHPAYRFAHDVFRHFVYVDMSEPRRRLMHRHIAQVLSTSDDKDDNSASLTAHHAALAGDNALAARACVAAGRHCLRLFANGEAETFARRGLNYADSLRGTDRLKLSIELLEISLSAKKPDDPEKMAKMLRELADQALDRGCPDHARLGYHLLGHLRWNLGEWGEAHYQIMQAQVAGQAGTAMSRALGLAEMARCLVLLERDVPQADAMMMEAMALTGQAGQDSHVFALARGMLLALRGEWDAAAEQLHRARALARAAGDRVDEFQALEILSVIAFRRHRFVDAQILCRDLVELGKKIREGSELPCARAIKALTDWSLGNDEARCELEAHLTDLRDTDAKHRLTVVLTLTARTYISRGDADKALACGQEALGLALALDRPSDEVFARVAIARAALAMGDSSSANAQLEAITKDSANRMCMLANNALARLREDLKGVSA